MPNKRTAIQTNSTPRSLKEIKLRILTFNELWSNYPNGNPYDNRDYPDQCAIRLSVAFHRVGIAMKSFSSNLVSPLSGQPSIGRILLDGKATATRANELAEWLKFRPIAGVGNAEDITGQDWLSNIKGELASLCLMATGLATGKALKMRVADTLISGTEQNSRASAQDFG